LIIKGQSTFEEIIEPMKINEYIDKIPKLFDWYFQLVPTKRIQLNYIVIIAVIIFLAYKNDQRHQKNADDLSAKLDAINNERAKDQKEYAKNLEFYVDKFNHLLEMLIQQEKEINNIKKEV
jgi:hypothetical protein